MPLEDEVEKRLGEMESRTLNDPAMNQGHDYGNAEVSWLLNLVRESGHGERRK